MADLLHQRVRNLQLHLVRINHICLYSVAGGGNNLLLKELLNF